MEAAQTVEQTKTVVPVPTQEEGFGDGFAEEGDSEKAGQGATGEEGDFGESYQAGIDTDSNADDGVAAPSKEAVQVKPEDTVDYWREKAEREEKRALDNQAAFTRGQQELAELKAKVKPKEEPATEPEYPEEVRAYFEDFPEAKTAITTLAEHLARQRASEQVRPVLEQVQVANWERAVVSGTYDKDGTFIEGVPEYYRITAPGNKDYWYWWEKKGYQGCDPVTAITRLNEYKAAQIEKTAGEQAGEKDKENRDRAARTKEVLSGGLPASQRRVAPSRPKDDGSFSDGFNDE